MDPRFVDRDASKAIDFPLGSRSVNHDPPILRRLEEAYSVSEKMRHIFTSESVSEGHPDKMADQVSDAVLDACLAVDPMSRVACETLVTTGICVVAGENYTKADLDVPKVARGGIAEIGCTAAQMGLAS